MHASSLGAEKSVQVALSVTLLSCQTVIDSSSHYRRRISQEMPKRMNKRKQGSKSGGRGVKRTRASLAWPDHFRKPLID